MRTCHSITDICIISLSPLSHQIPYAIMDQDGTAAGCSSATASSPDSIQQRELASSLRSCEWLAAALLFQELHVVGDARGQARFKRLPHTSAVSRPAFHDSSQQGEHPWPYRSASHARVDGVTNAAGQTWICLLGRILRIPSECSWLVALAMGCR